MAVDTQPAFPENMRYFFRRDFLRLMFHPLNVFQVDLSYTRNPYTKNEDESIVNELTNILNGKTKSNTRGVWDKVAKKHNEKWSQGAAGFPQERSARSLLDRFRHVLIANNAETTVPEALIEKFNVEVRRHRYTKEEDNFIIEELSKSVYSHVFSPPTLAALVAEHTKRRKARFPGFETVRTVGSLRNHLIAMKNARQLPKTVLEKIHLIGRGAISSQATTSSQKPDPQVPVSNVKLHSDDSIADMIEELQTNSDYEIDFSMLE